MSVEPYMTGSRSKCTSLGKHIVAHRPEAFELLYPQNMVIQTLKMSYIVRCLTLTFRGSFILNLLILEYFFILAINKDRANATRTQFRLFWVKPEGVSPLLCSQCS